MAHTQDYTIKYKKNGFDSYYEIWMNAQFHAGPFQTLADAARWLEEIYLSSMPPAAHSGSAGQTACQAA
jgi:hypothetical protein